MMDKNSNKANTKFIYLGTVIIVVGFCFFPFFFFSKPGSVNCHRFTIFSTSSHKHLRTRSASCGPVKSPGSVTSIT